MKREEIIEILKEELYSDGSQSGIGGINEAVDKLLSLEPSDTAVLSEEEMKIVIELIKKELRITRDILKDSKWGREQSLENQYTDRRNLEINKKDLNRAFKLIKSLTSTSQPKQCTKCTSTDKLNNDGLCYGCACLELQQEDGKILNDLLGSMEDADIDHCVYGDIRITNREKIERLSHLKSVEPQKADSNRAKEFIKNHPIMLGSDENEDAYYLHSDEDTLEDVATLLNQFANSDKEWVSVEDRLPEIHKYVLLYDVKSERCNLTFIHEGQSYKYWTHWQERPNPPKVK